MAFEIESPASEETINRYDWESIPLLYESIGKKFCQIPTHAYVDRERDLILTIHGGSSGRDEKHIPMTYVLLFEGIPVSFFYNGSSEKTIKHFDPVTNTHKYIVMHFIIMDFKVPSSHKNKTPEIVKAIKQYLMYKSKKYNNLLEKIEISFATDISGEEI